jgi:D-3-phosphoglycerate dehydrogenase
MRVLVTTTSFLDTPGPHVSELTAGNFTLVKARGPLSEGQLLSVIDAEGPFDGFLVGEDHFSAAVLRKLHPHGKVISRYGVGLDKIDLEVARELGVAICNTPGVNHTTVTEHAFGLIFSLLRNIPEQHSAVQRLQWRRMTGNELAGKTVGVLGFGRVGREMAKRAMAFGVDVAIYNSSWSAEQQQYIDALRAAYTNPVFDDLPSSITRLATPEEVLRVSDIISLNMNLTKQNNNFLNARRIQSCKRGAYVINVSRGGLVDQRALADALKSGHIRGFGADVIEPEPISVENPLVGAPNVIITPHVGSRTVESIARQGLAAVRNLVGTLRPELMIPVKPAA